MTDQLQKYTQSLQPFLPEGVVDYVAQLIIQHKTHFRISPARKTKLGDYRAPQPGKGHRISVNGNLNPYAFLVTSIHEFAHLTAFERYGRTIKPHGKEWQSEFARLFDPVFERNVLPDDVRLALTSYLKKAKASSCTDEALYRVLKRYDKHEAVLVEHLNIGDYFTLNNQLFEKGKKLRKYYLCRNVRNNRQYRVLGVAEIEKRIRNEQ